MSCKDKYISDLEYEIQYLKKLLDDNGISYDYETHCDMERITMDRIYQTLKESGHPVNKWYYGHFHQKWT